jgi:hypothetical protein
VFPQRPGAADLFGHDLIRKPVPTFRDHALRQRLGHKPGNALSVEGLQRKLGPLSFLANAQFGVQVAHRLWNRDAAVGRNFGGHRNLKRSGSMGSSSAEKTRNVDG